MKLFAVAVLLAAACGSKSPATTTPGAGEATVALPDVPFDDLDHDQRKEFMRHQVVPTMKPLFLKHDADKHAGFGCQTCHGERALEGNFEMPNPKLPRLDLAKLSEHDKDDIEWMSNEVMPTMARLLREPMASEASPTGFRCLECHTEEGK